MSGRADLIPEHLLQEIRTRLPLSSIAGRRLQLKRTAKSLVGLCPFHGESTPSFHVYANGYHCFGCGAHGDVFGFVMQTEGVDFREAAARCAAEAGVAIGIEASERREPLPPAPPPPPPPDRAANIRRAAGIWRMTHKVRPHSAVARYLAGRGLWPVSPEVLEVLREADMEHAETGLMPHPVMVARVDDADGKLTAVHCTFLCPRGDGSIGKLQGVDSAKRIFGALPRGSAIRLGQAAPAMGVAEGIETALAASALFGGLPVWSTTSAGVMEGFMPPDACAELLVFADRDKPRAKPWRPEGQGIHSARVLAGRMAEAGRVARIRVPVPPAEDYADVLMARGNAA